MRANLVFECCWGFEEIRGVVTDRDNGLYYGLRVVWLCLSVFNTGVLYVCYNAVYS